MSRTTTEIFDYTMSMSSVEFTTKGSTSPVVITNENWVQVWDQLLLSRNTSAIQSPYAVSFREKDLNPRPTRSPTPCHPGFLARMA
jgi:hypothetical protein